MLLVEGLVDDMVSRHGLQSIDMFHNDSDQKHLARVTESAYLSGKVIVEETEMSFDEAVCLFASNEMEQLELLPSGHLDNAHWRHFLNTMASVGKCLQCALSKHSM